MSPTRDAIAAALEKAGYLGLSMQEARTAANLQQCIRQVISGGAKNGYWYSAGFVSRKRYFAKKEWADAYQLKAIPKKKPKPAKELGKTFVVQIKHAGFKKDAQIVIPKGIKVQHCPSAWKDKPLPDPDPVIVKRPGAEDWRLCGRGVF